MFYIRSSIATLQLEMFSWITMACAKFVILACQSIWRRLCTYRPKERTLCINTVAQSPADSDLTFIVDRYERQTMQRQRLTANDRLCPSDGWLRRLFNIIYSLRKRMCGHLALCCGRLPHLVRILVFVLNL